MANKSRRRDERREQAELRNQERMSRSDAEQIKLLDDRLGVDNGAVRERARLTRSIEAAKAKHKKKKNRKD